MFCFIHCLLGEGEEPWHYFFLNTGVHIKAFLQWVFNLVLKPVSVLISYKPVFLPDASDYQLQGFSGRQLSWTEAWQKSEQFTQVQEFLPQSSADYSKLYVLTEFCFFQYLFIYMLILARYFGLGSGSRFLNAAAFQECMRLSLAYG